MQITLVSDRVSLSSKLEHRLLQAVRSYCKAVSFVVLNVTFEVKLMKLVGMREK